jgi:aminoglycoside phosphotransferase (APT) family kinase protein
VWLHGDLHGLNVLAVRGRLSGVLDFGDLCAGDPATDLACGWLLLDRPGRERMREVLAVGDATWARGRGWALFFGLMFLAHSVDSPVNGAIGRRTLSQVLDGGAVGQS